MAKRRPDERDALMAEAALGRAYRDAATEAPPPALDARILAAAERAVQSPPAPRRFARRWTVPLSVAAVVMLSVGVVLRIVHQGALETPELLSAPPAAPSPLEPVLREESSRPAPVSPMQQAPIAKAKREPEAKREARARREADTAAEIAPQSVPAAVERMARDGANNTGIAAAGQASLAAPARAHVTAVRVRGEPGAYEFEVEIKSPDVGCAQYADWWEVVDTNGKLLYRRILDHSHVDEQPFRRSGGPVPVAADTEVWVRAHMNTTGYGGTAFKGSPAAGFRRAALAPSFAADLARQPPLPDRCAF